MGTRKPDGNVFRDAAGSTSSSDIRSDVPDVAVHPIFFLIVCARLFFRCHDKESKTKTIDPMSSSAFISRGIPLM